MLSRRGGTAARLKTLLANIFNMDIVPALLESDREGFKTKLEKLVGFASRIQVDFNDGSFSGFTSVEPGVIEDLIKINAESIFFEAHLMVQKPSDYFPKLLEAGFKKIIVQYEIETDIREILEDLKSKNVQVGLAIGPATQVEDIEPFGDLLDTVTVMDIEPGKQGQKFMPEELTKIRELKDGGFLGEVQADGAIDIETITSVVEAGVDTAVVGSYIVNSADPKESYETLWKFLK